MGSQNAIIIDSNIINETQLFDDQMYAIDENSIINDLNNIYHSLNSHNRFYDYYDSNRSIANRFYNNINRNTWNTPQTLRRFDNNDNIDDNINDNIDNNINDNIDDNIDDNNRQRIQQSRVNRRDTSLTIEHIVTRGINILTNLLDIINNTDNAENIINGISIDDLQELKEGLLMILRCDNMSSSVFETVQLERNNLHRQIETQYRQIENLNNQIAELQETLTPETICCICQEQPRTFVNISCGHMCACINCVDRLNNTCPICRTEGTFIRVIRS